MAGMLLAAVLTLSGLFGSIPASATQEGSSPAPESVMQAQIPPLSPILCPPLNASLLPVLFLFPDQPRTTVLDLLVVFGCIDVDFPLDVSSE